MLFACVKVGDKYGDDYVTKLRDGIARHCNRPHDFLCFTDKPVVGVQCTDIGYHLPTWWSKLNLFRLKRPLIYFDLDVVVTGDLGPLIDWNGFGIIQDWWAPTYNSSVMKLTGKEWKVWGDFTSDVMSQFRGDQDYITAEIPGANTFPAEWFPSYKANGCYTAVPEGAMAVIFHGWPKPHDCGDWVSQHWT